jgi:hopanoid biosynthesis associated RND transporter like protein HpnN
MIPSTDQPSGFAARLAGAWVARVQRFAWPVLLLALLIGFGASRYIGTHLSVDTNNQNMLSADLPWRKAELEMDKLFPGRGDLVVVIDGRDAETADDAQRRLVTKLKADPKLFPQVFAAETDAYFRRSGLLYLDKDALQKLADSLTRAQPFLGALNHDPSPHGLFTLLDRAITQPGGTGDFDLSAPLNKIAEVTSAVAAGHDTMLSWQTLLGDAPAQSDPTRRFIQIEPHFDYGQMLPAADSIAALRADEQALNLDAAHGVRLRLTGSVAMEHEELLTAFHGGVLALSVALVMVAVLLYFALRSLRLMLSAVLTLVYGLICTAAFAAAAVGHLNIISIAFGVLYVGLGIDYALYLCMQFRERLGDGLPQHAALSRAAADVGGFMAVCAATVSLAFFAFVPTSFTGIAELGLISGVGMFISLIVSLTVLPALITILPPNAERTKLTTQTSGVLGRVLNWPYRYAKPIWVVAIVLAIGALALAPRARFDYDPLNLRDPKSVAVSTFRELLKDPSIPTLTLSVLTPNAEAAVAMAKKLGALPVARRALALPMFVPQDQAEKLQILSDLQLDLGLEAPASLPTGPTTPDDIAATAQLQKDLPAFIAANPNVQGKAAQAMLDALDQFENAEAKLAPDAQDRLRQQLRSSLIGSLPPHLQDLSTALAATPVTEADLPPELARQWKTADGRYRVEIWPKEVLDNPDATQRFVDGVRTAEPEASGPPVGYLESGKAVVDSFRQAFGFSFVAIALLLVILLRSVVDTLLVLVPLLLAGIYTVGGLVLAHLPFNFANVIALPLVLGVGVDYGVYLVQRGRAAKSADENLLQTSTARAVLFGALITMANFGNLMLAKHPGMVGMGLLLTVGLGMTLICALVLLPSLLTLRWRWRARKSAR